MSPSLPDMFQSPIAADAAVDRGLEPLSGIEPETLPRRGRLHQRHRPRGARLEHQHLELTPPAEGREQPHRREDLWIEAQLEAPILAAMGDAARAAPQPREVEELACPVERGHHARLARPIERP